MRLLFKGLIALFILIVVAVLALPMLLKGDWVRIEAQKAATTALGRDVAIGDVSSISLFPASVSVTGLTIANAPGFAAPHFVAVETADIRVGLTPLLRREIDIQRFILNKPDIRLETARDGAANWMLGQTPTPETDAGRSGDVPFADVRLGEVQIRDGSVSFQSADGASFAATDADLTIGLTSLADPLTIIGTLKIEGEAAKLDAKLTTPRSLLEEKAADLALDMTVGQNRAVTTLSLADPFTFQGELDLNVPALRALVGLAGANIDAPSGFEAVRLKGRVAGDADTLSFEDGTSFAFDKISGNGNVSIDISGARPKISGKIAVPTLDLTPYLPATDDTPRSKGAAFPAWSSDVMDFSALREIDLALDLNAQEILLPGLTVDAASAAVAATNGRIDATLRTMSLYGGTGTGRVTMMAAGSKTTLSPNLKLSGIDVGAFASDMAGITRLKGTGDVVIDLTTTGNTQAKWVDRLNGTVGVDLDRGALEGINLGKIARGTYQAYTSIRESGLNVATLTQTLMTLTDAAKGPAETTDFTSMDLALDVKNGVATSRNINLLGPYFGIAGTAEVNLSAQSMRITLTPSASAIEGEDIRSLPIPILVSGTFNAPKIGFDVGPAIQGATVGALTNALEKQGINVPANAGSVEDALKGAARNELEKLLTKPTETPADGENAAPAAADPKRELLRRGLGSILGVDPTAPSPEPVPISPEVPPASEPPPPEQL